MARLWKTGKCKSETKPRFWNKREHENKMSNEISNAKKPRGLLKR